MKTLLSAAVIALLTSANAFTVSNLSCIHDMTPVDGPSRSLTLIAGEDGSFKAYYSAYNPWTNELKEQVLANKLPCTCAADDQRIAYCHRGASEGEVQFIFVVLQTL